MVEVGDGGIRWKIWGVVRRRFEKWWWLLGVIRAQKRVKILVNVEMTGIMDNDGWCWSDEWVVIGGRGRGGVE